MQLALVMLLFARTDVDPGAVPTPPTTNTQPGSPAPATVFPPPLLPYSPPPEPASPSAEPPPAPPNMRWVLVDEATLRPPPEPGFHKHDGFFMRALIGPAVGGMRGDVPGGQLRFSGAGLSESYAFGGAIRENVILFGEYSIEVLLDARVSGSGKNPDTRESIAAVLTYAAGIAYYFEPRNLYLSGSLGLALSVADESLNGGGNTKIRHDSNAGIGGSLTLGKEWWVSANWGLGAALRASLARTPEKTTGSAWLSYFAAALFSVTYN
jgi:hypothetical protein